MKNGLLHLSISLKTIQSFLYLKHSLVLLKKFKIYFHNGNQQKTLQFGVDTDMDKAGPYQRCQVPSSSCYFKYNWNSQASRKIQGMQKEEKQQFFKMHYGSTIRFIQTLRTMAADIEDHFWFKQVFSFQKCSEFQITFILEATFIWKKDASRTQQIHQQKEKNQDL